MSELDAYREKPGRKSSSELLIMRFHRSKQSVVMKSFKDS